MDESQRLKQKDLLEAYKIAKEQLKKIDRNFPNYRITVITLAAKIADLVENGEWIHEQ